MEKALVHRGYAGSIEISLEDRCLHGRLLYVDDLITYEAESVPELEAAFRDAVDRYQQLPMRTFRPSPQVIPESRRR